MSPSPTLVTIDGPVTITGSVSVSNTVDTNITNASIPVTGSVDITSGTVNANVTGGTIDIGTGTVFVENNALTALYGQPQSILVANGSVVASSGNITITAGYGAPTTRSMVALLVPTSLTGGTTAIISASATGNNSAKNWLNSSDTVNLFSPTAIPPYYFPMYGEIDTSVDILFQLNNISDNSSQFNYWIIALPDADLLGSKSNPNYVTHGIKASTPQSRQFTTTTFQQLVVSPAYGYVRVADHVSITATGQVTFGINSNSPNYQLPTGATQFSPNWRLDASSSGLYCGISATGGAIYVSYHDEINTMTSAP